MQDQYTGQAGTFIVDPDKGVRVPIEQWQAEQAEKQTGNAKAKPKDKLNLETE
jgi:hypothetical protein